MFRTQRTAIHKVMRDKGEIRANELVSMCAQDLPEHVDSYLDIGMGSGYNAKAFSVFADSVIGLDISIFNSVLPSKDTTLIKGSGQEIPLKNGSVNLITSISVIEHVPDKIALLKEAMRVLKPAGRLVLQFPNRYFFIELHSGIPFYFFFPRNVREPFAKKLGLLTTEMDIPTIRTFRKLMDSVEPNAQIRVRKVVYSSELISGKAKLIYQMLNKIGVLKLVPMGYLLIISK